MFACLALRSMLSRGSEPNASVASPFARIARSSGPSRNSAPRRAARSRSTVTGPATRHGVGSSSPGAVPVRAAPPASRSPLSPPAASPSSMPSNSPAGQLGPASTSMRSDVPSGPGFCEASLKTTGASPGPENWPVRWAGPSKDGAAASMSTPAISNAGPLAAATRTRPSRTTRRSTPVDWSPAIGNAGKCGAPSAPRAIARTGLSRLMSENRIWPLGSLRSASSSRAEFERQFCAVGARCRQRAGAERKIGRGQEPELDWPGQRHVCAGDGVQPRLDLGAAPGPVDEQGRHKRRRHQGDERDRDEGQDIAHGETISTLPRRTASAMARRASQFKLARKYDRDNKRRS